MTVDAQVGTARASERAVLRSAVYRDYLQLVRTSAGWKIANALWQWT